MKLRLKERGNPQVSGFAHHEEVLSTYSASRTVCTGRWNVSCDFLSWRFSPHSSAIAVKEVSCVKISFLMSTTNSHLKSYSLFPGHLGNFSNNKGRSLLQAVLNILLPMSTNSRKVWCSEISFLWRWCFLPSVCCRVKEPDFRTRSYLLVSLNCLCEEGETRGR